MGELRLEIRELVLRVTIDRLAKHDALNRAVPAHHRRLFLAAAAMSMSSVSVVGNALRLRTVRI